MFHVTVNYMCLVSSSTYLSTTSLVSYSTGLTAVLGWGWVAVSPSCDLVVQLYLAVIKDAQKPCSRAYMHLLTTSSCTTMQLDTAC